MITHPTFDVPQDTSGKYTAILSDENEVALDSVNLDSLELTLYDSADDTIINSRDNQDVLNTNGVTLSCGGELVWLWTKEDMPKLHTNRTPETHRALFRIVWNSGENQLLHEVIFRVHKIHVPG